VVALSQCTLSWGFTPKDNQAPDLLFSRKIFIIPDDDTSDDATLKKLSNLGYEDDGQNQNILGFQFDYGHLVQPALDPTGSMDARTADLIQTVYAKAADKLRDTAA
jgi:hypothetical protein